MLADGATPAVPMAPLTAPAATAAASVPPDRLSVGSPSAMQELQTASLQWPPKFHP